MDTDTASQFVSCLVRCIQAFCHGYVQFSSSIEIVGHIYLNVDKGSRFNYIVNEEVNKSPVSHNTVYHTNSYHSLPPARDMLLKVGNHQDHGVEIISDSRGAKNTESFLDIISSALPTRVKKNVSAVYPISLVKTDRADRPEVFSHNSQREEYNSHKSPPSTSADLLKVRTHPKPPQEQETSNSAVAPSMVINQEPEIPFFPSMVIKQEPEIPFFHETNHDIEGSLLADEHCQDDSRTVISPHRITNPRLENTDLPEDYDSISYETANTHNHPKALPMQLRQQIVAYADIVGNRPAARHFGVHESSIRHWRKKFGIITQGCGGRRGRKRKSDCFQDMRDEVLQTSTVVVEDSD